MNRNLSLVVMILVGFILVAGLSAGASNEVDNKTAAIVSPTPGIGVTDDVAPADDFKVDFGSLEVGSSLEHVVTVSSTGTADLVVGTVGDPEDPFSIVEDNCSDATLAPGGNCTITVDLLPGAVGDFSSDFDVDSNAQEMPVVVSLSGQGTAVPVPDINVTDSSGPADDLSVPFEDVTVGEAPSSFVVTISNLGTADLTVDNIVITGADADSFTLDENGGANPCGGIGFVLSEGEECTVGVTFAPSAEGEKSAVLEVDSDDPDEVTVSLALAGSGLVAAAAITGNPYFINGGGCSISPIAGLNNAYIGLLMLLGFLVTASAWRRW